jgi:hypothetical protein
MNRRTKKHRLLVFSGKGDSVLATWEVGDAAAEEFARGVYEEAKAKGWGSVVATKEGSQAIREFTADRDIFLLSPIAGG